LGQLKPISVILRRRVTKQDACYEKVVSQVNWIGNGGVFNGCDGEPN
jgi:hypothetical protein